MSMDLIISDTGEVMIASNEPFAAEIARVDLNAGLRLLTLNYRDCKPETEQLNLEIHDRLMSALLKAPAILLIQFQHNQPVAGWQVPLMQVGFSGT